MQTDYLINKYSAVDSLPIFSDLSFLQKRFIASKSRIVEFKKGHIIYDEGDPPNYFYCIVNGRVEIYHPPRKAEKLKEERIECVRRGDYFGSISSLTGHPHTVSARALNDSAVLTINRKDFNNILSRIPKLALFLSRSLSRRMSQRPSKKIFESTIIAIFSMDNESDSSSYASALADSLKKECGKKVLVVKSSSIREKRAIAAKLSVFTEDHHYVLVVIAGGLNSINLEIFKQSDIVHIISASDKNSLYKTSAFIKRIEGLFTKEGKQAALVILKEDSFYNKTSYALKVKILLKDVFATLPKENLNYKRALRRIAREISGVMVGLVLGSGAAMGFAHIGVLKVIEKEKVPVDIISATSMGALIAALWAAGFSARDIEEFACSFKSKLRVLFLADPTLPIKGLIKGRAVRRILKSYLGNKTFFDLKLPLKVVACDIKQRREFVIDKGNLIDAVMASIAIPGVFEPLEYEGSQLIDGGVVNPLPVSVLARLGIKRIIAVNTLPSPQDVVQIESKRFNIYDIIVNSFQAMEYTMALSSCQQADLYINPIPKLADWYEFYKAELFIKEGQRHTRKLMPKIKNLVKI